MMRLKRGKKEKVNDSKFYAVGVVYHDNSGIGTTEHLDTAGTYLEGKGFIRGKDTKEKSSDAQDLLIRNYKNSKTKVSVQMWSQKTYRGQNRGTLWSYPSVHFVALAPLPK